MIKIHKIQMYKIQSDSTQTTETNRAFSGHLRKNSAVLRVYQGDRSDDRVWINLNYDLDSFHVDKHNISLKVSAWGLACKLYQIETAANRYKQPHQQILSHLGL